MIAFWGLVVWSVVAVARGFSSRRTGSDPSAEHILAERFARGEIDEAQYRRLLDALRSQSPVGD